MRNRKRKKVPSFFTPLFKSVLRRRSTLQYYLFLQQYYDTSKNKGAKNGTKVKLYFSFDSSYSTNQILIIIMIIIIDKYNHKIHTHHHHLFFC